MRIAYAKRSSFIFLLPADEKFDFVRLCAKVSHEYDIKIWSHARVLRYIDHILLRFGGRCVKVRYWWKCRTDTHARNKYCPFAKRNETEKNENTNKGKRDTHAPKYTRFTQ